MTPQQYCEEKAAPRGSSLYYALLRVGARERRALVALHAWLRELVAIGAEVSDPGVAQSKLAWWAREVERGLAGTPQHPAMQELALAVADFSLPQGPLFEVLAAVEFDLRQNRYLDFALLRRQYEHTSGAVGELAATVLGSADTAAARQLGLALRLVAAIRDVGRQARRGRVELPLEDLQRFEVKVADVLDGAYSERFCALMRFEAERARALLDGAVGALPSTLRPARALAALYRALLDEVERAESRVLHQRIALTPLRKLWIATRA
ncbi:MAG: squalene/phytoene synthase family protein [Burkholderiales bacterium]|jgi:phytoene synthase|nr:squalene/phytoene synthase family protein [Burkholderiales bacterium]